VHAAVSHRTERKTSERSANSDSFRRTTSTTNCVYRAIIWGSTKSELHCLRRQLQCWSGSASDRASYVTVSSDRRGFCVHARALHARRTSRPLPSLPKWGRLVAKKRQRDDVKVSRQQHRKTANKQQTPYGNATLNTQCMLWDFAHYYDTFCLGCKQCKSHVPIFTS